jgi:hypothetical protein
MKEHLLRCMSLKVAQSVNLRSVRLRPELGVKPTSRLNARTSQFDPGCVKTPCCCYDSLVILRGDEALR